ncbi:hypothetical protein FOXG_16393 [Fusarium oxysporum f. sp. lycopersici 4287]|uniref:NACHT domain-containing protein n=1 Tax=Fusarium oxysporum f. sp. lycopersici (strain 4287 / CBS 123668 / FGSC 9935 / NRRL 34936) TaxID=426428 RepID=A0A0J9W873_FUSO4|nr:uncharacterized protein FOXG_16393 [Fusarium oxysporum f. sp. lycopersici 4287]KNB19003.1 hypothetical protein FOXG_16393 [Fusarium oxysporum f. sp. lycopersici 4287]
MRCLKHLYVTDPRDDKQRILETKGGLLKGSYCWILKNDRFQRFRDDPQSRLLWIKGDPGKGKTMLLCGIIDELEKESAKRLSYFFLPRGVLRGLIYLLIIQQPSLISYVRTKYDTQEEKRFESINAWAPLTDIFMDMLNDPALEDVVLIIDALDECKTKHSELLDFIFKSPSHIKWIVSSRNHCPDIGPRLRNATHTAKLCLEDIGSTICEAVDVYIRHKVDQLICEENYDDKIRYAVQHYLMSHANGTFLWVALVCKELADPRVPRQHMLTKLTSFPAGLDQLYERMMEHIINSDDAGLCKQILAIVSVVYSPVTLKELISLVESLEEFDQDELKETIGSCGSFLTLRKGVIYFVHQSAKEYLLDKASNQIVPSGTTDQHHTIFSRSLLVMSRSLRRDMYDLHHPGISIDDVRQPDPNPLASARYSCFYWVDHLSAAVSDRTLMPIDDLQDDGTVHQFLSKKYLYWLEALSLLGRIPKGVVAMTKLETLLNGSEGTRLFDFVRDARRFILAHGRAIRNAPLQAYVSALTFSPRRSVTRRLFKEEEPSWILAKPTIAENWDACLETLEGHDGGVNWVVFSPDGQRLASASREGTVKMWDIGTGHCTATLEGHGGGVHSVVFSLDGQRLASASHDTTVKIWDATTGHCMATLRGHDDEVCSVAFSLDGQRLASASRDRTVKIWDATTGECTATLEGHHGCVNSVVFSPDGQRLASASIDRIAKIWDATTVQCLATLVIGSVADTIRFDKTGTHLLTDNLMFNLNLISHPSSFATAPASSLQPHPCQCQGYGISADRKWITYRGRNLLWLPFEYRPVKSAIATSIALGCSSGWVLLFQFSGEGPILS